MTRTIPAFFGLLSICLLVATPVNKTVAANTASDQRKVQKEIKQLSDQIDKKKQESSSLNSEVTQLEKELGELTQQQHQTEKKIEDAQARIVKSDKERSELATALSEEHAALAQQLQAMHTAGEQSHLRLLLLQDNPSDLSRNIQYFNYLNRYRSEKIKKINQTKEKLEAITSKAKNERLELKALQDKLSDQKEQVAQKLNSREQALSRVNADLSGQKKRLTQLQKQERALQEEIERIAREAAKRRAAELAARKAAEKRREAKRLEEERRRQQQQQAAANNRRQQAARQRAACQQQQQRPAATKPQQQPTGRAVQAGTTTNKQPFSKLKGKMSWPVNGRVINSYGSRRNEKQRWQGVVIAAPGGSKVKAVAAGRVVFAGWMNGYGHLIIVEHDNNYLSLYGYNRAVFKRVGQAVRANETIAAVGNSSGRSTNALYFEIRRKTVPQNPARWLR